MKMSRNSTTTSSELASSERELLRANADLIDAHEQSRPMTADASAQWHEALATSPGSSRGVSRRALLGLGGAAALGVLAATSMDIASGRTASAAILSRDQRPATSVPLDIHVAALAASLEVLAVSTYVAGLKAAGQGKFGAVPPAFAKFAKTAMSQHNDHALVWNNALAHAGYAKVTKPDPIEAKAVASAFAKVHSIPELAQLALLLESVAAATYLEGLTVVASTSARQTAASIHPVEMQHVAILRLVLGETPVPTGFASTALARPISDTPFT